MTSKLPVRPLTTATKTHKTAYYQLMTSGQYIRKDKHPHNSSANRLAKHIYNEEKKLLAKLKRQQSSNYNKKKTKKKTKTRNKTKKK